MFHVKHLDVRQGRQVGQYSGETGRQWSDSQVAQVGQAVRSQVRQARQALRRLSGTGASGRGRCAPYSLARPYAKSVPYCFNFC